MWLLKKTSKENQNTQTHKALTLRNQFIQKNTLHLQRADLYTPLEWKSQITGGDETSQPATMRRCVEAMSLRESGGAQDI